MESHEANHEIEPSLTPPPPPPMPQLPQRVTMPLAGPNLFTNSTVTTTIMTPVTARFPLPNMNTNPSIDSFNNINATVTAPLTSPSTTFMPCMTVVGDSSSHFPSDSGLVKRKRGRPKKYFTENGAGLGSGSGHAQAAATPTAAAAAPPDSLVKSTKGKGRPRRTFNRKNDVEVFDGLVGMCFSPYVIIVNRGEDIIAKLTAACRGGPNSEMCILAAHGSVSTVALHRPGKITTYEGGQFEIISLSGTLLPGNNNGDKRMGSWKVTLGGGPNAHLWGGVVADKLIAASSVKVILGSFTVNGKNASSGNQDPGPSVPSFDFTASGTPTDAVTPQGHLSESSVDNEDFPFDEELAAIFNNVDQTISDMELYQHLWARHNEP